MDRFDLICVGAGGVGSAVLHHAAARGLRALGIDRFPPGHDRGSSHGESRIIRLVYMEHPGYVPLLRRAYELWDALGEEAGRPLLHPTGILYAGRRDGGVIAALERCATEHALPLEQLTAGQAEARFPAFRLPSDYDAAFESVAGYLEVEACVRAYAGSALAAGATLRIGETVTGWEAGERGVTVTTDHGRYEGARLVLAPGAWAPGLARLPMVPFEPRRKVLLWYEAPGAAHARSTGCPLFFFETPAGSFYGFPDLGGNGLKVAEHTGGERVADPLAVDRSLRPDDRPPVEDFLAHHLPGVSRRLLRHEVCLYTMTPDEHFVVDRHPESERVLVIAGLSGHGYKFTSVLGEVAATWAAGEGLPPSLRFLSLDRFREAPAPSP